MILNRVEKLMMNNPIRSTIQRYVEARELIRLGGRLDGGRALEVGCGRGIGVSLILDVFGADHVDAFDLDPLMVENARRRLRDRRDHVRLWTGDAAAIDASDGVYDAVFDFGIVHHVPAWRDALSEIHRVLKPGGRFYAEEVLAKFINQPLWRFLLDHPSDDRFDFAAFVAACRDVGFAIRGSKQLWGQFAWVVAEKSLVRDSAVS